MKRILKLLFITFFIVSSIFISNQMIHADEETSGNEVLEIEEVSKNEKSSEETAFDSDGQINETIEGNDNTALSDNDSINEEEPLFGNQFRDDEGTAYAVLTSSGDLIFFRSEDDYVNGSEYTVIINDSYITGEVYTGIETLKVEWFPNPDYADYTIIPWYTKRETIKTVSVAKHQVIKPISTAYWFYKCKNVELIDLTGFDTSKVEDMSYMFALGYRESPSSPTSTCSISAIILRDMDTSNVKYMRNMFSGCSSLTSLDVSGFDTSKVTDMNWMFNDCSSLTSLDVSRFDTSNVSHAWMMFYNCSSLTHLDVSHFNTSSMSDMADMFAYCSSLTYLDVSHFDTSNATYGFGGMFWGCSSLTSVDVSNFDTSNVSTLGSMFEGCSSLTSVDVSHFDTSKVETMGNMFMNCSSLTSIDVSNFDTSNLQGFLAINSMFEGCSSLTSINLSNFNTSNVTSMQYVFRGCSSLTSLDLSSFDTSKVTHMYSMFSGCSSLKELNICNFDTSRIKIMANMFDGCDELNMVTLGSQFVKWMDDGCLPEGDWFNSNGYITKNEKELCEQYPSHASEWKGTWRRKTTELNNVFRLSGTNRYLTSRLAAVELLFLSGKNRFNAIVLTTGESYPDALSGSYLASVNEAPIILINEAKAKSTRNFIRNILNENGKIFVIGGEDSVSENCLEGFNQYYEIIRYEGSSRYGTNLEVLKNTAINSDVILVVSGNGYADSLSASATGLPVLLVTGDSLKNSQKRFLEELSIGKQLRFIILGSTTAVTSMMEESLATYGTVETRLSGKNRYETSNAVAEYFFSDAKYAIISYGDTFPDGLSGGMLANYLHAPLLLSNNNKANTSRKYTYPRNIRYGYVLGGKTNLSDSLIRKVFSLNDQDRIMTIN